MAPKKRTLRALGEMEVPQRAPKRAMKNADASKENEPERIDVDESQDGTVSVVENPAGNCDRVYPAVEV
jgi:hypothetical protein